MTPRIKDTQNAPERDAPADSATVADCSARASAYAALAARISAEQKETGHIPVMLAEVLTYLAPRDGGVYVDATFGTGGYTRAILEAADCTVYAIDRDPAAQARAAQLAQTYNNRLIPLHGCFGDVADLLHARGVTQVDGIVLDIGVSSPQLDQAARGFSFREDGPLDMRMSSQGQSAADIVNTAPEKELADIIFTYGEERAARRIARRIVAERALAPITTTRALAAVVHAVLPMHGGMKTDTATRTFQALRIAVNDELGELERALDASLHVLAPHGRAVVVSFHSLEDGLVKNFFRRHSTAAPAPSRHLPQHGSQIESFPPLTLPFTKPLGASEGELKINPRARSARLRAAMRTTAPCNGEGAR